MQKNGDSWVDDLIENEENWERDEETLKKIKSYSKKKDARINIRVPSDLVEKLKEKAQAKGLPYQTLIYTELLRITQDSEQTVQDQLEDLKKRVKDLEEKTS